MIFKVFFSIYIILGYTQLFALSDAAKFDMLKMKLTQQLKAEEYSNALSTMQELQSLDVKLPKSFAYFEGKALYETGSHTAAYKKLEHYVNENGSNGKYYQQALAYLIKAEEESKKLKQQVPEARQVVKHFFKEARYDGVESRKWKGEYNYYKIRELWVENCEITAEIYNYWYTKYSENEHTSTKSIKLVKLDDPTFRQREDANVAKVLFYKRRSLPVDHHRKSDSSINEFRDALQLLKQNAIESGCE